MSEEEWESALTALTIGAGANASGGSVVGASEPSGATKASPVLSVPVPVPVPVIASSSPVTSSAVVNKAVSSAELELADVTSIDDGLISALVNPRERLNALTYEKRILEFVTSTDNVLDIPPIYNSFHRLLLYRIAQRFNLDHCQSDVIYPYGERGICIIRTANTVIPRALLVEVSKRDDLLSQTSPPMPGYDVAPNTQSSLKPSIAAAAPAPGKIKVMKRNTSGSNMDKKSLTDKSTVDISDKEKAYAEARARIFGDELPSPEEAPPSSNVPTAPTLTSHATASPSAPAVPNMSGKSSSTNESRSPTASASAQDSSKIASSSQPPFERRDGPSRQVNPNSWSRERAVLRDREAERNDPDFARRPTGGVAPTLSYQGYGGMPVPAAPYGYSYGYGGGAMPPQGGYPSWQGQAPYSMGYAPPVGYQNPRGYGAPPPPPPPNSGRGYAPQSGRSYKDEFPQLG